jgi:hypothetical protein
MAAADASASKRNAGVRQDATIGKKREVVARDLWWNDIASSECMLMVVAGTLLRDDPSPTISGDPL